MAFILAEINSLLDAAEISTEWLSTYVTKLIFYWMTFILAELSTEWLLTYLNFLLNDF